MADKHSITMHDLPEEDRPRERLIAQGTASLATAELLAIILRSGTKDENVLQVANRLLATYDGLVGLARVTAPELMSVKGLGKAKAAQILAALELGRRVSVGGIEERPRIKTAADAARLLSDMGHLTQEQVRLILLDNSRRVIAIPTVYIGTVNMSVLRISEVFREAITRNSPAIILAHNHPSGDPSPSPEDVALTRSLIEAGAMLDIQVVDHLIIGRQSWKSLREMGLAFQD